MKMKKSWKSKAARRRACDKSNVPEPAATLHSIAAIFNRFSFCLTAQILEVRPCGFFLAQMCLNLQVLLDE